MAQRKRLTHPKWGGTLFRVVPAGVARTPSVDSAGPRGRWCSDPSRPFWRFLRNPSGPAAATNICQWVGAAGRAGRPRPLSDYESDGLTPQSVVVTRLTATTLRSVLHLSYATRRPTAIERLAAGCRSDHEPPRQATIVFPMPPIRGVLRKALQRKMLASFSLASVR
jgi:hypothetical protein